LLSDTFVFEARFMSVPAETIAAVATAQGRGGVGIVRISGPLASKAAQAFSARELKPRYAHYGPFYGENREVLDEGIALYFPGPNSFTGEDVLELQGHGGPVVLDMLLQRCIELGCRLARPGNSANALF
jgi:tRNA modification GTPase